MTILHPRLIDLRLAGNNSKCSTAVPACSVYIDYLQLAAVDFYSSTASVTHLINRVMDI